LVSWRGVFGALRSLLERLPLSARSIAKRDRSRSSGKRSSRLASSIAATRASWSRLQTYELINEGIIAMNSTREGPGRYVYVVS
jgi:hypothetical protein